MAPPAVLDPSTPSTSPSHHRIDHPELLLQPRGVRSVVLATTSRHAGPCTVAPSPHPRRGQPRPRLAVPSSKLAVVTSPTGMAATHCHLPCERASPSRAATSPTAPPLLATEDPRLHRRVTAEATTSSSAPSDSFTDAPYLAPATSSTPPCSTSVLVEQRLRCPRLAGVPPQPRLRGVQGHAFSVRRAGKVTAAALLTRPSRTSVAPTPRSTSSSSACARHRREPTFASHPPRALRRAVPRLGRHALALANTTSSSSPDSSTSSGQLLSIAGELQPCCVIVGAPSPPLTTSWLPQQAAAKPQQAAASQ
ncbi:unnamed protein product [Miscanthus lutarioriparius]|uniref:Uncharacterized protein n=1 Tax=Miscanthus lutarioriparius TaxID=422564 RepID=A0A811NB08_9POAL|nr:unnamed protein product [Miscanthus lutarioriparius]